MYAVTRTGTTVKSLKNDETLVTSGNNLGIAMLPLNNLTTVIPTVITRNTTASATDKADVKLNESATIIGLLRSLKHYIPNGKIKNKVLTNNRLKFNKARKFNNKSPLHQQLKSKATQ